MEILDFSRKDKKVPLIDLTVSFGIDGNRDFIGLDSIGYSTISPNILLGYYPGSEELGDDEAVPGLFINMDKILFVQVKNGKDFS